MDVKSSTFSSRTHLSESPAFSFSNVGMSEFIWVNRLFLKREVSIFFKQNLKSYDDSDSVCLYINLKTQMNKYNLFNASAVEQIWKIFKITYLG